MSLTKRQQLSFRVFSSAFSTPFQPVEDIEGLQISEPRLKEELKNAQEKSPAAVLAVNLNLNLMGMFTSRTWHLLLNQGKICTNIKRYPQQ